jgi:hypothetical protein
MLLTKLSDATAKFGLKIQVDFSPNTKIHIQDSVIQLCDLDSARAEHNNKTHGWTPDGVPSKFTYPHLESHPAALDDKQASE